MTIGNNVERIRKEHALTVSKLAARVGITRQTIYAIEAGTYIPNTAIALKLANELNVTVEQLFSLRPVKPVAADRTTARLLPDRRQLDVGRPVWLCRVGDNLIAAACGSADSYQPPADGLIAKLYAAKASKAAIQVFYPQTEKPDHLLLAGHCLGTSILAHYLRLAGYNLIHVNGCKRGPVDLLKAGLVHIAIDDSCHGKTADGINPRSGTIVDTSEYVVTRFTTLEVGLVVPADNPKHIQSLSDLNKNVAFVNQPVGSECRTLLDRVAAKAHLCQPSIRGPGSAACGGLTAAWRVYSGKADCCLATRSSAQILGLHFIPVAQRQFNLILRKDSLPQGALADTLAVLRKPSFRREMESLCDQAAPRV
jgi:putative molybdopterin biosynthesis protein